MNEENKKNSWHYKRTCKYCGYIWAGLHCSHDGYQNPCPKCNKRPKTINEICDCKFDWEDNMKNNEEKIKNKIYSLTILALILFIIFFGFLFWTLETAFSTIDPVLDASAPETTVYSISEGGLDNSTSFGFEEEEKEIEKGIASWYDYRLEEVAWSKNHATAASRTLERYSYVKVTNPENGKSVIVFINDYVENPKVEIDLSSYAFQQLAPLKLGLINVEIEPVKSK